MKLDLISIIVPIYNVEDYLVECVNSLIRQVYKNIEIILVDDGSPDNCPEICDEFAKKDSRIRVFHKQNGGLSDARNYGIECAKGKYVCFVDSDDFVSEDYIQCLYNGIIQNNADISICGFTNYLKNGKKVCKIKHIEGRVYDKINAHIYLNVLGYFDVASWNKIYKKELFDNIKFPVGKTCEDWRIMYKIFDLVDKIYYDSTVKYFYRRRENSITTSKKVRLDSLEAALDAIHFYEEKEYKKVLPYAYQSLMIACMGITNSMIDCKDYSNLKKIYDIKKTYKYKITYRKLKLYKKVQLFFFLNFTYLYKIFFKTIRKGKEFNE